MTSTFMPPHPSTYTPPLPLGATTVLDILATHTPELYNQVMQVVLRYCHHAVGTMHGQTAELIRHKPKGTLT